MTNSSGTSAPTAVSRVKAEGAFVALAAGDALGWPQEYAARGRTRQRPQATTEFRDWERRSGGRYYAHTEIIRAGEYSDDTQLTLAVARSRICGGTTWWTHFSRNELPLWTLYERGGGGATKRAADSWIRGAAPWKQQDEAAVRRYFDAGGNGVAMRVLPHAVYCAADDDAGGLLRDVVMDGVATHGNPRALVGAGAYAYAAWWLLRSQQTLGFGELVTILLDNVATWGALPASSGAKNGWFDAANRIVGNYEKAWREVVDEMVALLKRVHDGLAAGSLADDDDILHALGAMGSTKGSGTVSTAAAVYLTARYAAQPVQGVLRAAFAIGADTDTIAAMTGGLMGSLAGTDWLPREWFSVQDCDYLRQSANKVAAHAATDEGSPAKSIGAAELSAIVEALASGAHGELDFGGRPVRVADARGPEQVNRSTSVSEWTLRSSEGQTIHIAKLSKRSKAEELTADRPGTHEGRSRQGPPQVDKRQEVARAMGVKLTVANLAASVSFYEGVLGLVPLKRTPKFVAFSALSLVDGRYAVDLSGGAVAMERLPGRNRIEVHVNDLDSFQGRLVANHVRVVQPITVMPWGERSLHCLDPDGNVVELVERGAR